MSIVFRQEMPSDYKAVEHTVKAAFENEQLSDQTEHLLVARLRSSDAFVPEFSIVAEENRQVIGHVLLTKIHIKSLAQENQSLALAPISILPAHQNRGIGSNLIRHSHQIAKQLGYQSIVLIGHANYYPRFGYKRCCDYGITFPFPVPEPNGMICELVPGVLDSLRGEVVYDPAFMV